MFVKSEQLWDIIPNIENLEYANANHSSKIENLESASANHYAVLTNLQSANHTMSAQIEANKAGKLSKTQYD